MSSSLASWRALLAEPGDHGHIVQLYQDEDFYAEAVSHFAAEGIVRDESVILVATTPHWEAISARLRARDFDTERLLRDGQLNVLDADRTLPKFMENGLPDAGIFKPLAKQAIARARAQGKFSRVRWWGEMVAMLHLDGNQPGSTLLEKLFSEVSREESVPLFHSYLMDKFDPGIYEQAFGCLCLAHTHVIPAEDYPHHRLIVNRAVLEVIGQLRGPLLQSLLAWREVPAHMPSSQALLLWIRQQMPDQLAPVLARARDLERAARVGKT